MWEFDTIISYIPEVSDDEWKAVRQKARRELMYILMMAREPQDWQEVWF